jgi:hypothetical protein
MQSLNLKKLSPLILILAVFPSFLNALPIDLRKGWEIKPVRDLEEKSEGWMELAELPVGKNSKNLEFDTELRTITIKKEVIITENDFAEAEESALSLHIPFIGSYYEIYWNGQLLYKKGVIANGKIEEFSIRRHLILPFSRTKVKNGKNELRIVLAGYKGYNIDVWDIANDAYIKIDTADKNNEIISERVTLMLMFLYFFMGLYHFLFYYKRPQEEYNLYYGAFSFLLSAYIYTRSNAVFELDLDGLLLKRIEFSVIYYVPAFMVLFLDRLFLGKVSKPGKIYFALLTFISLPTMFGPGAWLNTLLLIWQVSVLYVLIHIITVSVLAYRRKIADIKRLLVGILVLIVCGVWDVGGAMGFFGFQNLGLMRFGFFFFVIGIAFILANRFLRIHKEVEELNEDLELKVEERTEELQKTLGEVQELKVQQDGDYFLTSLLINPLTRNSVGNSIQDYDIQFFSKQKKTFEFRGRKMEIGGDINIVDRLNLRGREFIVFVNGDAMGKSIQGAGGALVLGVIFHSVVTRTNQKKDAMSKGPESWLKECFLELQSVFETFDGSMLISVVMGLVDVRSGFMFFVNSEHPWTVLYRDGKAGFLEDDLELRKIGTMGIVSEFRVKTIQLQPDDVIFVGSDGRDDILLGRTEDGDRIINEDESLFLACIEEGKGELDATANSIFAKGELTDDLSIIRLSYAPDHFLTENFRSEETERLNYLLSIAKKSLKEKDYVGASVNFSLAAEEFPQDMDSYYLASYSYKKRKDYQDALNYGERLFLRDPSHIKNLLNLADIHRFIGNYSRSSILLQRIDELEPGNATATKIRIALERAMQGASRS